MEKFKADLSYVNDGDILFSTAFFWKCKICMVLEAV